MASEASGYHVPASGGTRGSGQRFNWRGDRVSMTRRAVRLPLSLKRVALIAVVLLESLDE